MTVALIDADIIVYESAFRCQDAIEWEPGEWTHAASMPDAQADFRATIEFILRKTGCDKAVLALTDSDRDANFRRKVWPKYKDHREGPGDGRPLLYRALREWIRTEFTVREKHGIEGDDTLGIMATLPGDHEPCVICSVDKDLDTIPGRHFNWRKEELGVYEVDECWADYNFMFQTLTGDSTDGYPGLPGCGPVRAERILAGLETDGLETMWINVVAAYEKKGLTEGDALIQARCARILQACDWDFDACEPILWEPPTEERTNES